MEEYRTLTLCELDDVLDKLIANATRLRATCKNVDKGLNLEKLQKTESKIHQVINCMKDIGSKIQTQDNVYFI